MVFALGLWLTVFGYALLFTGWLNFRNGGNGPTLRESLGFPTQMGPRSGQTGSRAAASGIPQPKAV